MMQVKTLLLLLEMNFYFRVCQHMLNDSWSVVVHDSPRHSYPRHELVVVGHSNLSSGYHLHFM